MLLYILYIIKIGGDFMSGRFFSAPFLLAVIIISRMRFSLGKPPLPAAIAATALTLALLAAVPFYRVSAPDGIRLTDDHGITDERLWYYGDFGLFSPARVDLALSAGRNGMKARRESVGELYVIAVKNTGVFGYYAGPSVFVIDQYALSDPLLARLPAERKVNWRVGHYSRVIPDGYIATIYDLGRMGDEELAQYYDKLAIITGSHLFSPARLVEIWKMNTGQYDYLIDEDAYRYPQMVFATLGQIDSLAGPGKAAADRISFSDSGLQVDLGRAYHAMSIRVCLEGDDEYEIEFHLNNRKLAWQKVSPALATGDLACQPLEVPAKAAGQGFDRLRVFPMGGNGEYGVGRIELSD